MDANKLRLATTVDYELADGSTVKCTLAMIRLKQLASKDKALYQFAMKVLTNGPEDILDIARMVYVGYVCANMDNDDILSADDFTMMCGSDFTGLSQTFRELMDPKNKMASANRS